MTTKHLLLNLRRDTAPADVPAYDRPGHYRGMPVLLADSAGKPRCGACHLCEQVCPTHCIDVSSAPDADRGPALLSFDLDLGRCLFCGLCEDVCPDDAIVLSPVVELAAPCREGLRYSLEDLLVPEARLAARRAWNDATARTPPRRGLE